MAKPGGGCFCSVCASRTVLSLLQCGNLMLVEVIPKEPLSFSVFHYKSPKLQHTVQVTGGPLLGPQTGEVCPDPATISRLLQVSLFKSPPVGQIPARKTPLDSAPEEADSGEPRSEDPS